MVVLSLSFRLSGDLFRVDTDEKESMNIVDFRIYSLQVLNLKLKFNVLSC